MSRPAVAAGDGSPAVLIWLRADGGEVEFPLLGSPLLVGRDEDADIRVDEPLVSRAHARIERRGGAFFVLDLGSTNRTQVNGEPVAERELRDGDEVRFARARCRFVKAPVDPVGAGV
ncbi:MAG TPA: FHA domain-containing protein [Vicinamibacteria bacterium]|nr:FHA domain-containing protein [Vicinamibacteria bacterium]